MGIKLNNVRLSFPSLWSTEKFNQEDTGKYACTFILDKIDHAEKIEEIKSKIAEGIKTEFKGKDVPADKICLKDGDESGRDEYANSYIIKGSTKKRPTIIDRDKTPLLEEDGKPYSGCYVNAIIDLWYQNNNYGKRVNCNLLGVQFYKDGESFGAGPVDVTDDFDSFDDDF
ncbi:MAG: ssDNA-binding protein [Prevotella sp.]